MKKIILAAFVAVASLSANAQVWLGGSLGFESEKDANTTIEVAPEIGYTIDENWDVAVALGFENVSPKHGDSQVKFNINPYARYTFYKTGNVGFFLDGGVAVELGNNNYETKFGIGIRPGVKFAASDKVTFVASLGGLGYEKQKGSIDHFGLKLNGGDLKIGAYISF